MPTAKYSLLILVSLKACKERELKKANRRKENKQTKEFGRQEAQVRGRHIKRRRENC